MALNLADRIAVRANIVDRCTAAVANYALYILGNVSATANQTAWAKYAILNAKVVGNDVSWHVLNQQAFIDDGSGIADATLGNVVEAAINNHFITPEA